MDNVVDIVARLRSLHHEPDGAAYERFLLDEGLELLAAYRSIEDADTRTAILTLVKRIAA